MAGMFSSIWHGVFFDPIYNGLIFILNHVPGGDVGVAIIILTVVIKLLLLPLSVRATKTQHAMRELEPKLAEIKEKHKDDREKLARETMGAYKEAGVNPFASILLILIQLPVIIALYLSVYRGGGVALPAINVDLLYSFVPTPETATMMFLGFMDIAARSFPLAFLAGVTQFYHTRLSLPPLAPKEKDAKPSFKDDFQRSMQMQMRYVMPIIIFFVAYTISAAIALYFLVSNLMAIAQEYFIKWHVPAPKKEEVN